MIKNDVSLDELVARRCYNFLSQPVIVTSGESITPFFLNGEKLLGDRADEYKKFEMDPWRMFEWVEDILTENCEFRHIIENVANDMDLSDVNMISGGRTRDWPFASALSIVTRKPTLFLYKPEDNMEPVFYNGKTMSMAFNLSTSKVFHIVDLVTTASSIIGSRGWTDQIRARGGNIDRVYAMIDRNQGAKDKLGEYGVELFSGVRIDGEWLERFDSKNVNTVLEYLRDPQGWSMSYLESNGIDCLMPYLDSTFSQSQKDNRLLKFLSRNSNVLEERGLMDQILESSINYRPKPEEVLRGDENLIEAMRKYHL